VTNEEQDEADKEHALPSNEQGLEAQEEDKDTTKEEEEEKYEKTPYGVKDTVGRPIQDALMENQEDNAEQQMEPQSAQKDTSDESGASQMGQQDSLIQEFANLLQKDKQRRRRPNLDINPCKSFEDTLKEWKKRLNLAQNEKESLQDDGAKEEGYQLRIVIMSDSFVGLKSLWKKIR
jgi:hypothetical protein